MLIDSSNYSEGNRAMAWVLLLYYHLLDEGGFTNDQTTFVEHSEFDAFQLCTVEVDDEANIQIDGSLIREGAVIHILSRLDDFISEYEDNFLGQPFVKATFVAHGEGKLSAIPEADDIFRLMSVGESGFDYPAYRAILATIFNKYVVARFRRLLVSA